MAFFLPGDSMVNDNLIERFMKDAKTPEERRMFIFQMAIEAVHEDTYGLMFYTLYDEEKIDRLRKLADESPYMNRKFKFMEKWTKTDAPFAQRLLAFACVEGIFFCVLFAIIFWFRERGSSMSNLIHSNELISKDETLHRDYACFLHKRYGPLEHSVALEIVMEAVEIEEGFIDWLVESEGIEDLTPDHLKQYLPSGG